MSLRNFFASFLVFLVGCSGSGGTPPIPDSEVYLGVDLFACTNPEFPTERAFSIMEGVDKPVLGILLESFGSDYRCIGQFVAWAGEREHLIRIHLCNEVCRRNDNCSLFECLSGLSVRTYNELLEREEGWVLAELRDRLLLARLLIDQYGNERTRVMVSTGLEEQFSDAAGVVVDRLVREAGFEVVGNPVRPDIHPRTEVDLFERHSNAPPVDRRCIAALDGVDIEFPHKVSEYPRIWGIGQVLDWGVVNAEQCEAVLLWSARSQGLGLPGGTPLPRERLFELLDADIFWMNHILRVIQDEIKR